MKPVNLWDKTTSEGHLYAGPTRFKATCDNCGEPRNRHCGRCLGCPGGHMEDCMKSHATGAFH
jgi:hypothetical protein